MSKLAKKPLKEMTKKLFRRFGLSSYFAETLIESLWRDPVPAPPEPDGIRSGGIVTWLVLLMFHVTKVYYYLQNKSFSAAATTVTLDPADETNPRIDVIAVNIDQQIIVIKGTPAIEPQKPTIDPTTQIELTFVLVPANATEPADVAQGVVYDEHAAGEFTPSATGVVVNFDYATEPFSGVKCADVGAIGKGDKIIFTASEPQLVANYEIISAFIKLKAATSNQHFLLIEFLLSGVPISNALILFSSSAILEWQSMVIKLSNFTFISTEFDAVCFRWSKSGKQEDHSGFYLDLVKLEKGIQQPVPGKDGKDGFSAYEIAVINGFDGNEQAWLESLVGAAGDDGAPGTPGDDGADAYVYVAYASDNAGTGFSLTPTDLLKYRAEIHTTAPLTPPVAGDFTGATWVKYLGDDGTSGGGGSDVPELHLDFEEAGDEFTYNVPYAMKFTSMVCEGTDATLSIALNTNLARYDKLTVTATAAGLVSLIGEYLP